MVPNIHILGIQGSGKGTQSARLVEKYTLTYLSSGNLFRARSLIEDEPGRRIAKELRAGHLLPTPDLLETVHYHLEHTPLTIGLLGDGVIRTLEQYYELQCIWDEYHLDTPLLIHLLLDETTAIERIQIRQKEQNDPTKYEFHKIYSGKLIHRTDDNPQAIHERFAIFHRNTEPVIKVFAEANRCIHIDANQTVEAIHLQICKKLEQFYPRLSHGTD